MTNNLEIDVDWPRRAWLAALITSTCWLVYCVCIRLFVPTHVERLAASRGLTATVGSASSWFPGQLRVVDVEVIATLAGASCRASSTRLDMAYSPFEALGGVTHIDELVVNDAEVACDPSSPASPALALPAIHDHDAPRPPQLAQMRGSSFAASLWSDTSNGARRAASTETIHVAFASIDVTRLRIGELNIRGDAELLARRLSITEGDWPRFEHTRIALQSVHVASRDRELTGNLSLTLDSKETGSVDDARRWTGRMQPTTWHAAPGARIRFSKPSRGSLWLTPSFEIATRWQAKDVSYRSSRVDGQVKELDAGWTGSLTGPTRATLLAQRIAFDWQDNRIRIPRLLMSTTEPGASRSNDAGTPWIARTEASSRRLVALDSWGAKVTRSSRDSGEFDASAKLQSADPPPGLHGSLTAKGDDASAVLMLAGLDRLPSWIESKFDGEPFALETDLETLPGLLQVSNVHLQRGAIDLRGWWQLGSGNGRGALLMRYGGLAVGIDAQGDTPTVAPATAAWLENRSPTTSD